MKDVLRREPHIGKDREFPLTQPPAGDFVRGAVRAPQVTDDIEQTFLATTYSRVSAGVRLVACFAAMHTVFVFSAANPGARVLPTTVMLLFVAYSGALYWRAVRNGATHEHQLTYWADTVWYLTFTALTGGASSHFSYFLPFSLLFISFRWGFRAGITAAGFSSAALLLISIVGSRGGESIFATDILLPPVALLVLGYLMAIWASSDVALNQRLASLKEFNALFNPRFNIEQTIDRVVRHLAKLYRVEKFALVILETGAPAKAFRGNLPEPMYQVSEAAAAELAAVVGAIETKGTFIYSGARNILPAEIFSADLHYVASQKHINDAAATAARFDCAAFGSIQFNLRHDSVARLFVWSSQRSFGLADIPFFRQLGEQLSPRIENAQLLDRLANEVAEHERQKISRDIHDSAIQPYIGLKFGLEALARRVAKEDPLAAEIARLVEATNTEVVALRHYVKGLRGQGDAGRAALVPALHRQAARFGELYGIRVEIVTADSLRLGDDLANEAFHMVSEALSNIRRHTSAAVARIHIASEANRFTLQVTNPCRGDSAVKLFTPRSIAERARALGGTCQVESVLGGETVVTVQVPLTA